MVDIITGVSDRFLQDGSFLRLRTLSLGYTLPKSICETIKVGSLRVYVSANNVYTKQNTQAIHQSLPILEIPFEVGFDNGNYPIAEINSIWFGP